MQQCLHDVCFGVELGLPSSRLRLRLATSRWLRSEVKVDVATTVAVLVAAAALLLTFGGGVAGGGAGCAGGGADVGSNGKVRSTSTLKENS